MAMTMPQGLRLEPMVADIQRLLKVGARMYMCMTRATLDRHGRDGEMPVRLGLRAYGRWRGTEMREAHLPNARLEWKRLICRGDEANEVRIERG